MQKWFHWTVGNDLAAKKYMEDGKYLVRCRICNEESFHKIAVYICPKKECFNALSILNEILGHELKEEEGDWYTSETEDALPDAANDWWNEKDTAESNHPGT